MDTRNYSKDFLTEFIDLYKSFPCLWKVKSKEYSDRNKKTAAYAVLIEKLKEVEPESDRDFVIKKINNLRSSFRKELKKILASKRSGAGADDVYKPTLWYFDLLSFLTDQETPRSSKSSMDIGDDEEEQEDENSTQIELLSPTTTQHDERSEFFDRTPSAKNISTSITTTRQQKRKRKKQEEAECLLTTVKEKLQNVEQEDEFDVIGKNVAIKLRNLPSQQRILAEKFINDVLFEAQLGSLNRNYSLTTIGGFPTDIITYDSGQFILDNSSK